jgi:hypothetical protein
MATAANISPILDKQNLITDAPPAPGLVPGGCTLYESRSGNLETTAMIVFTDFETNSQSLNANLTGQFSKLCGSVGTGDHPRNSAA